jgi:tetratricopeptide (TPR) repeat protein
MKKKHLKIISRSQEFSTKVKFDGETYLIDSEDLGINHATIITRVYLKGKIIYSHKFSYKKMLSDADLSEKLSEVIKKQQELAVQSLKMEKAAQNIPYRTYIKEAEALINEKNLGQALEVLYEAGGRYPNNPVIVSYQGYLETVVNRQYSKGVETCRQAIKDLMEQMPLGKEFFLPTLYLNLGKACLAADKKKDAYESFKKGLKIDKTNEALFSEMKSLGIRRKVPISFLSRSNPLNKYLGMLLYSGKNK